MRARARALSVALAACAGLAGCDIYEIGPALAALDASQQTQISLADRCADEGLSVVVSDPRAQSLSFDGLTDTIRTLAGCNGIGVTGPDGFVRLPPSMGERWVVVAEPLEATTDVVLYMLPSCDPAGCTDLVDRCGAGVPESFALDSHAQDGHVVGVDTRGGGGAVELTFVSPHCGDRKRELGEGCDDGNENDGDGCDRECRVEISTERPREIEPNNQPTEANAILSGGPSTVIGRLGGACDVDYFAVRLTTRGSLRATLLSGAALPCESDAPEITMTLLNADGRAQRGTGETGRLGGACPSIEAGDAFAEDLEPGVYFLSIEAQRDITTVDYSFEIQVVSS